MPATRYFHTQTAPRYLLLAVPAALMVVVAFIIRKESEPASIVLSVAAVIMALTAISFRQLTVVDAGDRLGIRFGQSAGVSEIQHE